MKRRWSIWVALVVASACSTLPRPAEPIPVTFGNRVRVTLSSRVATGALQGTVVSMSADTLVVAREEGGERRLSRKQVESVEVSLGQRRDAATAAQYGVMAAAPMLVLGLLFAPLAGAGTAVVGIILVPVAASAAVGGAIGSGPQDVWGDAVWLSPAAPPDSAAGDIPGARENLPACRAGCSIWDRDQFFRRRGLPIGQCDVSALLRLTEAGEVTEVEILRGSPDEICGATMRDWALSTRWEPAPGEPERSFTIGISPPGSEGESAGRQSPEFRTYSVDKDPHVLLVHLDPDASFDDLRRRFGSGLGSTHLIDEAHSHSSTLCTVGATATGEVVLRADPVTEEVVAEAPQRMGPDRIVPIATRLHPDLQWLLGELLADGGSCFLLRR